MNSFAFDLKSTEIRVGETIGILKKLCIFSKMRLDRIFLKGVKHVSKNSQD